MKIFYSLLALSGFTAFLAACGGGDDNSSNGGTVQQQAVNAQGARFAAAFNAPNNSEPGAVQPGDAGPSQPTSEPNRIM